MPYDPPPHLAALSVAEVAALIAERRLPPVATWSPAHRGDSEMRISRDGRWYHQGGEITRPAMLRAFSGLLRRDAAGGYALVTPAERLSIIVEDAPFMAVEMEQRGDALLFRLNSDDLVIAGPDHPLRAAGDANTPALYLMVRDGLEARLNRNCYLALVELALASQANNDGALAVSSQGASFVLVP